MGSSGCLCIEHSGWIVELHARMNAALPRPIFKMILIEEATMERTAVNVHFDGVHLFLDMSEGPAVQFPLDWFPVLQAATVASVNTFPSPWTMSRYSGPK